MGNKIIIDEEVLAKLDERISIAEKRLAHFEATQMEYSMHSSIGLVKGLKDAKQLILENSTTISIDESIEESAEKSKNRYKWIDERDGKFHKESYIIGATEQSIISEIKSKEFKKCGIGDNVCNCKEEKDCGYL